MAKYCLGALYRFSQRQVRRDTVSGHVMLGHAAPVLSPAGASSASPPHSVLRSRMDSLRPPLSLATAKKVLANALRKRARLAEAVAAAKTLCAQKQVDYELLQVPEQGVQALTTLQAAIAHFAPFLLTPDPVFTMRLFHVHLADKGAKRAWKKAFHHLSRLIHPDKNLDSNEGRKTAMWHLLDTMYTQGLLPENNALGMPPLPPYDAAAASTALMV